MCRMKFLTTLSAAAAASAMVIDGGAGSVGYPVDARPASHNLGQNGHGQQNHNLGQVKTSPPHLSNTRRC